MSLTSAASRYHQQSPSVMWQPSNTTTITDLSTAKASMQSYSCQRNSSASLTPQAGLHSFGTPPGSAADTEQSSFHDGVRGYWRPYSPPGGRDSGRHEPFRSSEGRRSGADYRQAEYYGFQRRDSYGRDYRAADWQQWNYRGGQYYTDGTNRFQGDSWYQPTYHRPSGYHRDWNHNEGRRPNGEGSRFYDPMAPATSSSQVFYDSRGGHPYQQRWYDSRYDHHVGSHTPYSDLYRQDGFGYGRGHDYGDNHSVYQHPLTSRWHAVNDREDARRSPSGLMNSRWASPPSGLQGASRTQGSYRRGPVPQTARFDPSPRERYSAFPTADTALSGTTHEASSIHTSQPSFTLPLRSSPRQTRSYIKDRSTPRKNMLQRPMPTKAYEDLASRKPTLATNPHRLLVILDLNGTLLFRHKGRSNSSSYLSRPHLSEFLTYLFANHSVMVWSSARPENVAKMCTFFGPDQKPRLVEVWARDKLRLSREAYDSKVQVYKQLSWVWEDAAIQATCPASEGKWEQSNTILIDDSHEKAASEPWNIVEVDEFEGKPKQMNEDALLKVIAYMEDARKWSDVSAFMKENPFRAGDATESGDRLKKSASDLK